MSEPRAVPDDLRRAVEEVLPGARTDLESLVRIPSIWADPAHADDTRRSADAVAELARAAGAQRVDVIAAEGGAPAVVAHWPAPDGAPTVMLYAHHDVQPTGGDELWTTAPFEPHERDGRLYGRGAADDKAGVMTHLAVLRAFGGRPPVGVVLFVEGEEESGSPTLSALLAEHRDALAADVIVIADAANAAVDVPALTTSLRGLANVVVEVAMLERAAHSGMFGGPAGDALTALCHLLASLHDAKGDVAVPGLTVGSSDAPSPDEGTFRGDSALLDDVDLLGTGSITERLAHKPAIAVLGIDAPAVDGAANVLLPRARAMVSVRLAPGDEVTRAVAAVTEHLRRHVPWGAHLEVSTRASAEPFALDTTDAVHDLARTALGAAFGHDAVDMGMGGSIPFIAEFARTYPGATVMVTGVGDPASRWHGIDESLHLEMFGRCALAEAEFLRLLAEEPYTHADSVHVDAAPEAVYDVVADVTRTGEWSVFTRACEWDEGSLDADGRPVVGACFTGHNSRPGRDWDTRSEVVAADRGREFAWAVNGGLVRWAYEMVPEESASGGPGTRLTQRWVFTPEGREFVRGKFGEDGVALRVEDARTSIPTTLARVRAVVEGQAGVAGAV